MNARQGGHTKALQAYIVVDDSQERDCRCYARESIVLELLAGLAHEAEAHVHDRPPSYLTHPHPRQTTQRDRDGERDEWDDEQKVVAPSIPAPSDRRRNANACACVHACVAVCVRACAHACERGHVCVRAKVQHNLMRTYFQMPAERTHEGDTKSTSKLIMLQI